MEGRFLEVVGWNAVEQELAVVPQNNLDIQLALAGGTTLGLHYHLYQRGPPELVEVCLQS